MHIYTMHIMQKRASLKECWTAIERIVVKTFYHLSHEVMKNICSKLMSVIMAITFVGKENQLIKQCHGVELWPI